MKILQEELNFYTKQGKRTKVKKGIFDIFPNDISKICRIIQGLLIHPCTLKRLYGLDFPMKRIKDRHLKTIQSIINKIFKLDKDSLLITREPKKRVVDVCRQFSMFLCSVLREKGIPARERCGFATYFINGWFEDHWICEYWNKKEKRWVRVDPQIDDIQIVGLHIDRKIINFLDLPKGAFFPAGVLWKLYREGFISGKLEGFSKGEKGEQYIRGNMLRDFFSLNEIEYTYLEEDSIMSKKKLNETDLKLLDKISKYTSKPEINFKQLRELFKKNKSLKPKEIKN